MGILVPDRVDCWMQWKERATTVVKEGGAGVGAGAGAKVVVQVRAEAGVGAAVQVVQDPGMCQEVLQNQGPDRAVVLVSFLAVLPGLTPAQSHQMLWMSSHLEML